MKEQIKHKLIEFLKKGDYKITLEQALHFVINFFDFEEIDFTNEELEKIIEEIEST